MHSPTVPIDQAYPAAVSVAASTVRVGDLVFSTTGGTSPITRVTTTRAGNITITPTGSWPVTLAPTDTITIIRTQGEAS